MYYPVRFYYSPFSAFDRLFEDAFAIRCHPSGVVAEMCQNSNNSERRLLFCPRMDFHENNEANTVTSSDISIEIHQNRLTVCGEFNKSESKEDGCSVRERHQGKFSRTIQLPVGIKPDDVKAKMEDGLLSIVFPKATAEQQPNRITIS
ncbi:HSP20-like chaperone [Scleroderma yunnanense]